MIQDQTDIVIDASPEKIFGLIETMPNKFPVYRILETKPILFLRMLLVDGFRAAIDATSVNNSNDTLVLKIGDSLGPFKLTEFEKPLRYWFTLDSFFFNCRTGYSLNSNGKTTILNFDIVAENPRLIERLWWFFVKPIHGVLANKVLRVIKKRAETVP